MSNPIYTDSWFAAYCVKSNEFKEGDYVKLRIDQYKFTVQVENITGDDIIGSVIQDLDLNNKQYSAENSLVAFKTKHIILVKTLEYIHQKSLCPKHQALTNELNMFRSAFRARHGHQATTEDWRNQFDEIFRGM